MLPLPPGQTPRAWQLEALTAVRAALRDFQSVIVSAATGTGKGSLIAGMSIAAALRGRRVLLLAHRDELIEELVVRVRKVPGAPDVGVVKGTRNEWLNPQVVASVQSLNKKRRGQMGRFDLLLIDECHHATAPIYVAIIESVLAANPDAKIVGFTATAFRSAANGGTSGLGKIFQAVVFEYAIGDAIANEDLVPVRPFRVDTQLSLEGVRVSSSTGDFVEEDLARVVDVPARNDLVAQKYLEFVAGKPALVFCASIEHAEHMAEAFVRAGVRAKAVWGNMPAQERRDLVGLYKARPDVLPVLCSKDLIFEGFDAPATAAVLKARPTKSRVVFTQMVGRGLRLHPGKTECLFLDFVDNGCELTLEAISDLSETTADGRKGRPLLPGDKVMRRHHDTWGAGFVDEVRPGEHFDVAVVEWPATATHPEGARLPHPVNELRRAPEAGPDVDAPEVVEIQARVTGHQVYELLLLPGQRPDDADAIGWYEHNGTWTVGGWKEGIGRIRMHLRKNPDGKRWDVWSLRPPLAHEVERGAPEGEDVCTLRETKDSRNTAIAWANEYLRANGAEVAPVLADWKSDPASAGQAGLLRALGIRRDASQMSKGQASALIDAVTADRAVGDVLNPGRRQRREWVQKRVRGKGHGAQMSLGAK